MEEVFKVSDSTALKGPTQTDQISSELHCSNNSEIDKQTRIYRCDCTIVKITCKKDWICSYELRTNAIIGIGLPASLLLSKGSKQ